jgi:hypothetical protein
VSDAIQKAPAASPLAKALRYVGIILLAAAPVFASGQGGGVRFAAAAVVGLLVLLVGVMLGRPRAR